MSARQFPKKPTNSQGQQKCCLGALYYSQSLMDRRSAPVCGGLRKTRKNAEDLEELQSQPTNLADFKYICVGYSIYDEDRIRKQPDRMNLTEGDVHLPYCEGVEIISSRQLQRGPVLLKEGIEGDATTIPHEASQRKKSRFFNKDADLPSFATQPGKINWDKFPDRFMQSSTKILLKMQHNANYLMDSVKRLWDR